MEEEINSGITGNATEPMLKAGVVYRAKTQQVFKNETKNYLLIFWQHNLGNSYFVYGMGLPMLHSRNEKYLEKRKGWNLKSYY